MRRVFLFLILAILAADASGLEALVFAEPCTAITDTQPDGGCPALCVRCACCAHPIVPALLALERSVTKPQLLTVLPLSQVVDTPPGDIFHVPKSVSLIA